MIGTAEMTVATATGEEVGVGRVTDGVGTLTTTTVMTIMTPRATDTVPAMWVAMTTDTTHRGVIAAIETTTMSAIRTANASVQSVGLGARANAAIVLVAGLALEADLHS